MAIYHNSNFPYYANYNGESVDKIYYNGTLVFPHFLYKLMPNFRTAPNSVPPHKINTGIGITRVEARDPGNNSLYWSGEYLEHGYLKQTFDVRTMYNYTSPSWSDVTVTWSPNGESTINNSRSNRKKCQPCTISRSVMGYNPPETQVSVSNPNDIPVTVIYYLESNKFTKKIAANSTYKESFNVRYVTHSHEATWDPLGGYIPAEGSESPNPAPSLRSSAKGEVTVNNNYYYACTHYVVYSSSDPSLKNATVVWSGTLQGSSSYPGNHHTLTNQRSGYYGAFCGDPKYGTSPWVGMYLIDGYTGSSSNTGGAGGGTGGTGSSSSTGGTGGGTGGTGSSSSTGGTGGGTGGSTVAIKMRAVSNEKGFTLYEEEKTTDENKRTNN